MLSYVTGGQSHEDDGVKLVHRPVVLETKIQDISAMTDT